MIKESFNLIGWETQLATPDQKKQSRIPSIPMYRLNPSKETDHWRTLQSDSLSVFLANTEKPDFFFNWDSLHARLNSHYETWSYKKGSTKKIIENLFRKNLQLKDVC